MWGQVPLYSAGCKTSRIIPTRVGTSLDKLGGENGDRGSSPRVWGQVDADFTVDLSARIIPTRVGTSFDTVADLKTATDHPHACGDKFPVRRRKSDCLGSSPRVWGQATHFSVSGVSFGIIPTRVGTSKGFLCKYTYTRDHPHACGDKEGFAS